MARIIAALAILSAISLSAADWPQFLGPQRNNTTSERLPSWPEKGPERAWSHPVGSGWSGPVVKDGKVVLFHREGDLELIDCREAATGKLLWQTKTRTEYVDGFNFDNGPRATPAIVGDDVYCFGAEASLHCVNLKDGKIKWSNRMKETLRAPKGFFGQACSPLVTDGLVLLNVGAPNGHGIVAINADTGKVAWKATNDEASYSSPILVQVSNDMHAVFVTRNQVVGFDPKTGKIRWRQPFSPAMQASVSGSTPLFWRPSVFVTASYGAGAKALSLNQYGVTESWANDKVLSCQYHTPLIASGLLYGFHGRLDTGPKPEFRCVSQTGRLRWKTTRVRPGAIVASARHVLILTVDGELIRGEVSMGGFEEQGRAQVLGLDVRAHPAYADGRLFARDKKNFVCLNLR